MAGLPMVTVKAVSNCKFHDQQVCVELNLITFVFLFF